MPMGGPYGLGTSDPHQARERLKSNHTADELLRMAKREVGTDAVSASWPKGKLAKAIVEARERRSRGGDWGLERDI